MLVYADSPMYCACWYDLDPIQGQGHAALTVSLLAGPYFKEYRIFVACTYIARAVSK